MGKEFVVVAVGKVLFITGKAMFGWSKVGWTYIYTRKSRTFLDVSCMEIGYIQIHCAEKNNNIIPINFEIYSTSRQTHSVCWKNNNIFLINFEIYSIYVKRIGYVLLFLSNDAIVVYKNSLLLLIVSSRNALFMSTSECSHYPNQAVYYKLDPCILLYLLRRRIQ